jgi:hypothetical protein
VCLARFRGASAVSTKFAWLVGSCPNIRVHAVWLPAPAAASAFEEQNRRERLVGDVDAQAFDLSVPSEKDLAGDP